MKVTHLWKSWFRKWSKGEKFLNLILPISKTMNSREENFDIISYEIRSNIYRKTWPYPEGGGVLEVPPREIRETLTHEGGKRKTVITGNHCIPYLTFYCKFYPLTRNVSF